ncbi:25511_t:CDS:2, partial [Gigaspora rosea]
TNIVYISSMWHNEESIHTITESTQRNSTPKSPNQDNDFSFITKEDPTSSIKHPQNKKGKETFKPNIEDIDDNIEQECKLE